MIRSLIGTSLQTRYQDNREKLNLGHKFMHSILSFIQDESCLEFCNVGKGDNVMEAGIDRVVGKRNLGIKEGGVRRYRPRPRCRRNLCYRLQDKSTTCPSGIELVALAIYYSDG